MRAYFERERDELSALVKSVADYAAALEIRMLKLEPSPTSPAPSEGEACMGSHEVGPCGHPRHNPATGKHDLPAPPVVAATEERDTYFCPCCGPGVKVDEDECCASCGATCCTVSAARGLLRSWPGESEDWEAVARSAAETSDHFESLLNGAECLLVELGARHPDDNDPSLVDSIRLLAAGSSPPEDGLSPATRADWETVWVAQEMQRDGARRELGDKVLDRMAAIERGDPDTLLPESVARSSPAGAGEPEPYGWVVEGPGWWGTTVYRERELAARSVLGPGARIVPLYREPAPSPVQPEVPAGEPVEPPGGITALWLDAITE